MSDKLCPFCGHNVAESPFGHVWCDQCDYRLEVDRYETRPREDELERQLAEMTADRDSEKRWADEYSAQVAQQEQRVAELEEQLERATK